jgi:hypothetical protein
MLSFWGYGSHGFSGISTEHRSVSRLPSSVSHFNRLPWIVLFLTPHALRFILRPLPRTILTGSRDFQSVPDRLKTILRAYALLKPLNRFIRKFDDLPAFQTNQMIVVLVPKYVFVMAVPLAENHLAQQTALDQQCQRSVHRGLRYPMAVPAYAENEVFGFKMLVDGKRLF